MQENGFWEPEGRETITVEQILAVKEEMPLLISAEPTTTLGEALHLMHEYNITQISVITHRKSVGSLNDSSLMTIMHDGIDFANQQVHAVMSKPLPEIDIHSGHAEAYRILLSGNSAIVVCENDLPVAVLTRIDLIDFWVKRYAKYAIRFHFLDTHSAEEIVRAITERTRMIWIESPTNPLLNIVDIGLLAKKKTSNIWLVVDNTFATPFFQRPLTLGPDIIVHSTTKYLGRHSGLLSLLNDS